MGTIMKFNSEATKYIKPNIVNITISISSNQNNAKDAINEINTKRSKAKNSILNKSSYRSDSYHQSNISIRKLIDTETYYVHVENDTCISEKDYKELPFGTQTLYRPAKRNVELGYMAHLTISAILDYKDTTVDDIIDIFNMSIASEINFKYEHAISDEFSKEIYKSLYAECVNTGLEDIKNTLSTIYVYKDKEFNILSIEDTNNTATYESDMHYRCMAAAPPQEEQFVMPELIEDMFNNTKKISRSLTITIEV